MMRKSGYRLLVAIMTAAVLSLPLAGCSGEKNDEPLVTGRKPSSGASAGNTAGNTGETDELPVDIPEPEIDYPVGPAGFAQVFNAYDQNYGLGAQLEGVYRLEKGDLGGENVRLELYDLGGNLYALLDGDGMFYEAIEFLSGKTFLYSPKEGFAGEQYVSLLSFTNQARAGQYACVSSAGYLMHWDRDSLRFTDYDGCGYPVFGTGEATFVRTDEPAGEGSGFGYRALAAQVAETADAQAVPEALYGVWRLEEVVSKTVLFAEFTPEGLVQVYYKQDGRQVLLDRGGFAVTQTTDDGIEISGELCRLGQGSMPRSFRTTVRFLDEDGILFITDNENGDEGLLPQDGVLDRIKPGNIDSYSGPHYGYSDGPETITQDMTDAELLSYMQGSWIVTQGGADYDDPPVATMTIDPVYGNVNVFRMSDGASVTGTVELMAFHSEDTDTLPQVMKLTFPEVPDAFVDYMHPVWGDETVVYLHFFIKGARKGSHEQDYMYVREAGNGGNSFLGDLVFEPQYRTEGGGWVLKRPNIAPVDPETDDMMYDDYTYDEDPDDFFLFTGGPYTKKNETFYGILWRHSHYDGYGGRHLKIQHLTGIESVEDMPGGHVSCLRFRYDGDVSDVTYPFFENLEDRVIALEGFENGMPYMYQAWIGVVCRFTTNEKGQVTDFTVVKPMEGDRTGFYHKP